MGPVAQLEAREYSTEELDLLEQANKPQEFTSDDLDQKIVASVYDDPTYIPTRDEYFQAKELKARLKSEGKIPGLLENAATGAGQFLQTLGSSFHEIVDDPGEFLARSPATMKATAKKSWRNTNDVTRWIRQANAPQPIGRDEQTGEFVFGQVGAGRSDAEVLASQQLLAAEQGRTIRPVTDEDLKDEEFDRFIMERSRQKELEEWVASTTAPTEFITRLTTGRNQIEQPMQATSDIAGGLLEPTNIATMAVPFSAGAKTLGASRLAKEFGAGGARILERAAARGIDGMEAGAFKFQEIIQKGTRITPENQTKIAKWSAAGGIGGGVFGLDTDVPVLSQAQDGARFIGGSYLAYKFGLGTLRSVQKVAGPTSTILRVAANPAEGFDDIAQASVAAKLNAFPELSAVREIVENPTRFRPIESTPARLAADPRLGPQTRAIADALSNPLIVQGVRGASAVAGGAVKGAAFNAPFVALALNADEEKAAANMLGLGAGFGAFGGAVNRFTGVQQRRTEARASDTARMFLDVELAGGDVGKLAQTYSPQQLGDLASMQGFFREKVQFVPLNKADFDTNTQALGGAGAAGLFVQAPPGEKARIFINLDAKREGIVPHELGHALIKSGALGSAQTDSIRAFTTRRYTQAGVETRAREYATTIIQNENAAKFPGQNLPVSAASITAKMDELGQSGMLRGDIDPLDWARDEIFAEDFRQASQSMDFAAIRRNLPADGSWLGSMENLLAAQANALSISGVRIDPATGQPDPLFKANPILATDPVLKKQLGQYLNNYREWINHPDQTKARGVRVAPMARPQDLVNNPQVTFHDYGGGVMANEFARIDPATGQAVFRDQRDINAETAKRQQQIKTLAGSKLMPATDPNLGPKKTADGRVTVRGRILPQQFDFLNGFAQHQRAFARQFETAAANGESMMTRYHAIGTGDSGAFRIKNLGNLEAITREVIPWGWELTSKGNLLASVLDLTQFRNRAIKAINAGDPTLGRLYNNDLKAIESDLKQWMDNHRQDLPGSNKIGEQRRDAINSLIGIATNVNKGANPFSGKIAGPGSAIKQFRLDRLDTTAPTGRTGFHFDYEKANGNLLPEVATPLPDLSRDLPTPKGQAMPDETNGYRGTHQAPTGKYGEGSLDAMDKTYPDDLYSNAGARFYGDGDPKMDLPMHQIIVSLRGKPDAEVSVYRAVPKGVGGQINPGDWVTPSLPYAKSHGQRFDGGMEILSKKVRSGDLYTEGNSIFEYGWNPTPGQAMPDVVHSAGFALPKKIPQRGHFLVGAKSAAGHSMEYKVDPKLVVQPPVKDISQHKGERVIVLEADRYDTTNGRMGGPLHPFLISNQVVARTPSGEGYKAAWANMTSTFVSGTRNKVMNNTDSGRALIQLMAEDAHRSNRDFLNNYMAKVDAIKNTLSKQEVDALHVLLELGARQVQESKLPKPQMDFLKAMATAKSQATRGKTDNAKRLFSAAISKYGRTKWFQEISQNMANVSFVAEAANFTFQQRASAIDKVNGMHFLPSVQKDLKASEDFVGAKNLDVVASIQLSKNPDAFAVYFGKNKSEEAKMTNTERNLRDQFLRDPKFKVHPSYDWMMLSPENADNFLLDKPADLETLFPWYRQAHPKDSVRNGSKETVAGAIKRYSGINLKL
jgi:hypothetical protein